MSEQDQAHSELAPSATSRWTNCPGSVSRNKGREDVTSKYAAEGTVAHDLGAQLLIGKLNVTELEMLAGDTVMEDEHEIEIAEEMVEHVTSYARCVADLVRDTFGLDSSYDKSNVFIEQQVKVSDDIWGTCDCGIYVPFDCIVVGDLKYGAGVAVEVKDNMQLLTYAVGLRNHLIEKYGSIDVEKVTMFVYQPRARHTDGPYREWTITIEQLDEFEAKLLKYAEATKAKDAPTHSGTWCRWCNAKDDCPSLFEETSALATQAFEVADGALASVDEISIDQVAGILAMQSRIDDFMKACKIRAKQVLIDGGEVPGYRLVRGKSSRVWADHDTVTATLKSAGIKDPYTERKVLSPAQAEKALKKARGLTLKAATEKLEGYVQKIEGAPTMAPDHDPRQTLSLNPADAFDDVPDDNDYGIFN